MGVVVTLLEKIERVAEVDGLEEGEGVTLCVVEMVELFPLMEYKTQAEIKK
jgi:hypothetical protein